MDTPYSPLFDHIRKFAPLCAEDEALLSRSLSNVSVKKKQHLLQEGQVCTGNHFVRKGCLRLYMVDDTGNEQTLQFGIENWWLTDHFSMETGKPSRFYIQAVEASEIICFEKSKQEELFAQIPALERYFRLIFQRAYASTVMRFQYIFTQSGEERYHHFANLYPEFVQRVPQYMLASYLGFSPEFLSKIRAKKR